ncbi:hypothetical protein GE21DRAFT_1283406 [Neurospora crassa]|nr:hypothetical protein GE21DRAFT_1283406 [Neurospora crassa]
MYVQKSIEFGERQGGGLLVTFLVLYTTSINFRVGSLGFTTSKCLVFHSTTIISAKNGFFTISTNWYGPLNSVH